MSEPVPLPFVDAAPVPVSTPASTNVPTAQLPLCDVAVEIAERLLTRRDTELRKLLSRCESPVEQILLAALHSRWDARTSPDLLAFPSHPSIRLWKDSQEVLIPSGTETAPSLDFTSKIRHLAGKDIAFCDQPRPLRRVYFLGDGSVPKLIFQRMTAAEAIVEWVKHSFLLDVEEKTVLAGHFDQVAQLACKPIYYRLDYPRCFEDLTQVRQAIVKHVQGDGLD